MGKHLLTCRFADHFFSEGMIEIVEIKDIRLFTRKIKNKSYRDCVDDDLLGQVREQIEKAFVALALKGSVSISSIHSKSEAISKKSSKKRNIKKWCKKSAKRLKKVFKKIKRHRKIQLNKVYKSKNYIKYRRNLENITRYGWSAPRFGERIWFHPESISKALSDKHIKDHFGLYNYISGQVVKPSWPLEKSTHIAEVPLIKNCIDHWIDDIPWEKTGEYELIEKEIEKKGQFSGCKDKRDIIRRYNNLDKIFEQAKQEGRLRSPEEIDPDKDWGPREIIVHIGPNGEPFKGGNGMHRFAIAYILNIPFPAQIGFVHFSAIPALTKHRSYKPL